MDLRVLLSSLLCFSHALLSSCSDPFPSFLSEPASLIGSRGSAARLECVVSPPWASVSWRFRGSPLDPGSLPGLELFRGSLAISGLSGIHVGAYQCVATLDNGKAAASRLAHIALISALSGIHVGAYQCVATLDNGKAAASRLAHIALAEISAYAVGARRSLWVEEGGPALIECPLPPSVPPARPRLKARRDWVHASTGNYLVLPSGNLQIISVSAQDQGVYRCGAVNPVSGETSVQSHGTKLSVKRRDPSSPVRILYPASPVSVSGLLSRPLTLECVVSGGAAARWIRNGEEILPTPSPSQRRRHNNLEFTALEKRDEGKYACRAGTTTSAPYSLRVLEPASIPEALGHQTTPVGASAIFTCGARGSPAPNVTWLFNAAPLAPSARRRAAGATLLLEGVAPGDAGVYQCLVDNGIGSAQAIGVLTVETGPEAFPTLHPVQSDQGLLGGAEPVGGGAGPEGGGAGPEGGGAGPGLRVGGRGLRAGGRSLRAGGRGLRVGAPPPEAPIITSPPQTHKPDLYELEWRAGRGGGSPINAYFVKYRKVDELGAVVGGWNTVRVPGSERNLRLSELEASSLYEVLMVARSNAGEGQPAMLTFRTGKEKSTSSTKNPSKPPVISAPPKAPEDRPPNTNTRFGVVIHDRVPEAPDRPTVSMATDSSAYVTWIPRANGGSPVTAFRVEYRRGKSAEWMVAADNISPLKLSVEIRNLEPGSSYKFRVVALNTYGESPHSIPSKPYQVPHAGPKMADRPVVGPHISSTDAISDTQIMLRWN
ncbi:cell adhesion molecule-related/down-regulated by oncogenes-like, partial [Menidia menidia]